MNNLNGAAKMNIKEMKILTPEELRAKRKMWVAIEDALRSGLSIEQTAEYTGASTKYVVQIDWKMKNPEKWLEYNDKQKALKMAQRKARRTSELRRKRREERKQANAPIVMQGNPVAVVTEVTTPVPVVAPIDIVNNPPHYTVGGISVFQFIEAKGLNYGRGNVIKYVTRAGVKDSATELQDLEKAAWYLAAEIDRLKGKK